MEVYPLPLFFNHVYLNNARLYTEMWYISFLEHRGKIFRSVFLYHYHSFILSLQPNWAKQMYIHAPTHASVIIKYCTRYSWLIRYLEINFISNTNPISKCIGGLCMCILWRSGAYDLLFRTWHFVWNQCTIFEF
jgi:hypothetical protein